MSLKILGNKVQSPYFIYKFNLFDHLTIILYCWYVHLTLKYLASSWTSMNKNQLLSHLNSYYSQRYKSSAQYFFQVDIHIVKSNISFPYYLVLFRGRQDLMKIQMIIFFLVQVYSMNKVFKARRRNQSKAVYTVSAANGS